MRSPGGVALPATIGLHLAGDRRWRASEATGDGAQRFAPADPQQDLLTLRDRERAWPWLPPQRLTGAVLAPAHHEADHRRRAADLPGDVDQAPATCSQPERQLLLLRAEVAMSSLHPCSPVIGLRLSHR